MGNKRQRLARKRFTAEKGNGVADSLPPSKMAKLSSDQLTNVTVVQAHRMPESDDPELRRKEKVEGEREGKTTLIHRKDKVKTNRKHPLRLPGTKPGEGCFFCKSPHHIAKMCPKKNEQDRKKICLFCRERGHTLKDCPNSDKHQESKLCYNCGDARHRLESCPQPLKDGGTSYAECFLCKKQGHISRNCPSNPHGIYPKGGGCKICGEVTHLAKDCSKKGSHRTNAATIRHPKLQISTQVTPASLPGENGKRVVFRSGDDLGDDFDSDYVETFPAADLDREHPETLVDADLQIDEERFVKEKSHVLESKSLKEYVPSFGKKVSIKRDPISNKKNARKHIPKVVNFLK